MSTSRKLGQEREGVKMLAPWVTAIDRFHCSLLWGEAVWYLGLEFISPLLELAYQTGHLGKLISWLNQWFRTEM